MKFMKSNQQRHESVLRIEDLSIAYRIRQGEIEAVRDVSFEIQRGESFGIVGESGCGKTTLAWSVVDFLGSNGYVKSGTIHFFGKELTGLKNEELRRLRGNRITMVYQDPMQALNPSMRIGAQLKEVLTVHQGIGDSEAHTRCLEMLERVHMPDTVNLMERFPHQISGGQQQRVVIAMALLNNPALLIMDEPTTALDVTVEAAVLDLVEELQQDVDLGILFISHNMGVVARVCTHVGVMYAGELVERAKTETVFTNPRHPYTQGLLRCVPRLESKKSSSTLYPIRGRLPRPGHLPEGCIFSPRCDFVEEVCRQKKPELSQLSDGACVRCHFAGELDFKNWKPLESDEKIATTVRDDNSSSQDSYAGSGPILQVEGLKKYYEVKGDSLRDVLGIGEKRYVKAVEDASFSLPAGMTLGVVGESGSGKSTLIKTIIGLEDLSGGKVEFMGFDISKDLTNRDLDIVRELQMVFQNPDATLNPSYSIGVQIARSIKRFGTVPRGKIREEVVKLLVSMRLSRDYYDRYPGQLSGGEKQRVGIARAFASRPDLILADEPVSALDVSVQAAILNLLLEIQRQSGTTMVFIAHDLSVVRFISDFVAVMYLGQIMEYGLAEAIYAPPYHPYTEALLAAVPVPDPSVHQKRIRLEGTVPSALNPPSGCRFHTRCPRRSLLPDGGKICEIKPPPWRETGDGHRLLCHLSLDKMSSLEPVIFQDTQL
jgi:peptide/nickel transport system ATP-binding protein